MLADVVVGIENHLEIHPVEESYLEVDRSNRPLISNRVPPARLIPIVCVTHQIHLDLKMACIDGVGAFRLVWAIGGKFAEELSGGRVKKVILRFIVVFTFCLGGEHG